MEWIEIKSESDLNSLNEESFCNTIGVAIFKHSTRCSISTIAKVRLSNTWDFEDELPIYYLDLLKYRDISNLIASKFDVTHESPQLLIIKDGKCIFHSSHLSISTGELHKYLEVKN